MWNTAAKNPLRAFGLGLALVIFLIGLVTANSALAATSQSGSIGLEGKVSSPPPTQAASITLPKTGTTTTNQTITVNGICPKGLLVRIFNNNVFSGSAQCTNGSFSIQISLFSGRNELVAKVYDDLDQQGPDSNKVIVNFPSQGFAIGSRVSLTSAFAKRGADPGQQLSWPISISGGESPYAVSVDLGDGSVQDLFTQQFAGEFTIKHVYKNAGIYTIIVRASDKNKNIALLQLVGVANGQVAKSTETSGGIGQVATQPKTKVFWLPFFIIIPLLFVTFWLGRHFELTRLRKRLD